jgi:hypothetical protein
MHDATARTGSKPRLSEAGRAPIRPGAVSTMCDRR